MDQDKQISFLEAKTILAEKFGLGCTLEEDRALMIIFGYANAGRKYLDGAIKYEEMPILELIESNKKWELFFSHSK